MFRSLACLSLVAGLVPGLVPSGAVAAPPVIDKAFGNTIVSTYPDGRTGRLWLKPGGVYTAQGRRGDPSSGHWKIKGDKLCLKQSSPLPVPFSYCTPVPPDGMDHAWAATAVTGEPIRVQIIKGSA